LGKIKALNKIAEERGNSLAQMALAWVLRDNKVTAAVIGVSKLDQSKDCLLHWIRLNLVRMSWNGLRGFWVNNVCN